MRTIKFIGQIDTVQPVNISMPNIKGMPKSNGMPMIPASSIRGFLRHSMHDAIKELLAKNNQYLTVDDHYLLATGVDTGRVLGNSGQNTKVGANASIREEQPLLSVWGYWGLAGRMAVGNAVANSEDALVKLGGGSRSHVFNRNESLHLFVDPSEYEFLKDVLDADKYSSEALADYKVEKKQLQSDLRGADADDKAAIRARIEEIDTLMREAKDNRVGASEAIQRPIDTYECINQGESLPHRMTLKNPTDTELNIALWAIAMASIKPFIGGHNNANCGEVAAHWDVLSTDIDTLEPEKLGEVGFNDGGFYCNVEGFSVADVNKAILSGEIKAGGFGAKND